MTAVKSQTPGRISGFLEDLRKSGIDAVKTPWFLFLGFIRDQVGNALHQALPRVRYRDHGSYDDNDRLQVYSDNEAIYLTWTGEDPTDLAEVGSGLAVARGGHPAANGLVLLVGAGDLADDNSVRRFADRWHECLRSLVRSTGVYLPIFVLVSVEAHRASAESILERIAFSTDLWHYVGSPGLRIDTASMPKLIRERVIRLLLERFTSVAYRLRPDVLHAHPDASSDDAPPHSRGRAPRSEQESVLMDRLEPQRAWFRWMSDVQESWKRLDFLLRTIVIAAYGIESTSFEPHLQLAGARFQHVQCAGSPWRLLPRL